MAHRPYTRIVPGSRTVIIMIHGIIGTPDHFLPFLPLVPADWSVYNILLAGHGGNVRDFSQSSMAQWRTQVDRLTEQLSLQYDRVLIAAHSMGTLFALDQAVRRPTKIRGLFLMGAPLAVHVTPLAMSNAAKVSLDWVSPDDEPAMTAKAAYSIQPDAHLWRYLGWLPRYWELLQEIRRVRPLIPQVRVPCWVYQSRRDELVSSNAIKWLRANSSFHIEVLAHSTHFHYQQGDLTDLQDQFSAFCRRYGS